MTRLRWERGLLRGWLVFAVVWWGVFCVAPSTKDEVSYMGRWLVSRDALQKDMLSAGACEEQMLLGAQIELAVDLSMGRYDTATENAVRRDTEVYRKKLEQCYKDYRAPQPNWRVLAFKFLTPLLIFVLFFVGRWVLRGFSPNR